jgi:hypothetical protein
MSGIKEEFTFDEVLADEIHGIRVARGVEGVDEQSSSDSALAQAHLNRLEGLALSGGGIRSATFNLGVIQALAEARQLRRFDYLSTVSGGGYIGSWLSALLAREAKGNPVLLEDALSAVPRKHAHPEHSEPRPSEHKAIRFLRSYSNYLTPKTGLLSADSLAFVATYLRNLILNFLILIAFLAAALLTPVLLAMLFREVGVALDDRMSLEFVGLTAMGLSLSAVFFISANLARLRDEARADYPWYTKQTGIVVAIVIPITLAAALFSRFMWSSVEERADWYVYFALLYPIVWAAGWALESIVAPGQALRLSTRLVPAFDRFRKWVVETRWAVLAPATVAALVVGAALFLWFCGLSGGWTARPYAQWHLVTWGTPIMLMAFGFAMTLYIGLMGNAFSERGREWWSRLGAWLAIVVTAWSMLFAIAIYSGVLLEQLAQWAGSWLNKAIASGWLLATLGGVLAGRKPARNKASLRSSLLARVAPYVFILGLLMVVMECLRQAAFAYLQAKLGEGTLQAMCAGFDEAVVDRSICLLDAASRYAPVGWTFCALLLVGTLLSWRVDVNLFSLHMMYRNRLTRCYLGASHTNRRPQPFIGFDSQDDLPLASLGTAEQPQRPYPIINTALNMVRGRQLAWQQRKAANFILTPKFTGYLLTDPPQLAPASRIAKLKRGCYRRTGDYSARGRGISVGTAFAMSGAAASPNMGAQSSPAMTFLLTVFNVRLGRWCGNPLHPRTWTKHGPAWGGKYLFLELFGLTDEMTPFVYLSDGGHFENMGVYELVRRRCALIVVCDCGADPGYNFEDLGNAIQKCYTDFGIEISIDVSNLGPGGEGSKSHVVIGEIGYDKVDAGATKGKLILVKPCMNGDEPSDVRSYQARHPDFPQQPTTDQWFDEAQFESYRKLGHHIGKELVAALHDLSRPE